MWPDSMVFHLHQPPLVNLLGHAAGTLIFGIFLVLLWRDRAGQKLRGGRLSLACAALAFVWNAGSVIVLGFAGIAAAQAITVVLAMALSLLPACLLDLLLAGRLRWLARTGYVLSAGAMTLHALEQVLTVGEWGPRWFGIQDLHELTLVLTSIGFAVLTCVAGVALLKSTSAEHRPLVTRAVASMGLFLFALSFAHFRPAGGHSGWLLELVIHHAGLPVAMFLLLQDYRFLLVDAFLRFLANILLAAGFTWAAWRAGWLQAPEYDPRAAAVALLGVCGGLVLYALAREKVQLGLTRLLFHRRPLAAALAGLRALRFGAGDDWETKAALVVGMYFGAEARVEEERQSSEEDTGGVSASLNAGRRLVLGRRSGGRRYLSEDREALEEMALLLRSQSEQYHEVELKRLVSEAEFKALQAQIHPHFLFNALNTLYGLIPRTAQGARQTVLNLSDLLRYFLSANEKLIPLEEELRVVRAYLEIEGLRLGEKLNVEMNIDDRAMGIKVPPLTIQPLVENAVKHGIASLPEGGTVVVTARFTTEPGREALEISVVDSGGEFPADRGRSQGLGVGLENVRQRLRLHYGEGTKIQVESGDGRTCVWFKVPVEKNSAEWREVSRR